MPIANILHLVLIGKKNWWYSIVRISLLFGLITEGSLFATSSCRVVNGSKAFGSQAQARIDRLIYTRLVDTIIVVQVGSMASHRCLI